MKKYEIDGNEVTENNFFIELDEESETQASETVDDILDEQGVVKIGILEFHPSDILKNCDPVAYQEVINDIQDGICEDCFNSEEIEINGKTFSIQEIE